MKIREFSLQHKNAHAPKTINIDSSVVLFYSDKNTTGKTTLMRSILYTLGFPVPSTELVDFNLYDFFLKIEIGNKTFNIHRKSALLIINEQEFDLPIDQMAAHSLLFNAENAEILNNILGVIYFDQEKGWTLLNRGTIIGTNRFNVEAFFRGLKEDESKESYEIVEKIKTINKKISEYRLMLNVAEYQVALNQEIEKKMDYQAYEQSIESVLLEKQQELNDIEEELSILNDIIKRNKQFSDYLATKKIYVTNPYDENSPIRVTKENLFSYSEVEETNLARKGMFVAKRNSIKREIAKLEIAVDHQLRLDGVQQPDNDMLKRLSSIKAISAIEVTSTINRLNREKLALKEILNKRTKNNNTWITDAYKIISDYAKELNIPFSYKIDIFTSNLKVKSGTILHKMVFIYKLAYIKLLSQKLGYPLPIFCDSPSGREVKTETITSMLSLLKRDFSEHQIFFSSIYKYNNVFDNSQIFELDGTLFDEPTLFDK